ncbi:transferrin 2-like isoform X2 [Eurosta solidaginis]|uniref:transferrin 2-like isoform X2 n=1 Tax=Eurosta solidaginis TaxID=178769 RepID=UPI003530E443
MPKSNSCRRTKLPTEHIALMNVFIILRESRNKRACLVEVDCSHIYHWIVPIYTLQHEGGMGAVDCNNQVKTAANYFSNACAVHSLINKYNPIDDNSNKSP